MTCPVCSGNNLGVVVENARDVEYCADCEQYERPLSFLELIAYAMTKHWCVGGCGATVDGPDRICLSCCLR